MASYGEVDNRLPLQHEIGNEMGKRRVKKSYLAIGVAALIVVAAVVVIPTVLVLRKKDKKNSAPPTTPPNGGSPDLVFQPDLTLPEDPTCKKISNTSDPTGGYGPLGTANVTFKVIESGLKVPWQLTYMPGSTYMFVTEKEGNIWQVDQDPRIARLLLATVPNVAGLDFSKEGGLLGLAYVETDNKYLYVYKTSTDPMYNGAVYNQVERWIYHERQGTTPPNATFDKVILPYIPASAQDNGGKLQIHNGYLYVGTGEADNYTHAQDLYSLAGKILRVNLDGTIPSDNPIPGSATWIYGLRNVGGFDWLDNDTIVLADHGVGGPQGGDRIMVAKKGENMGWGIAVNCQIDKLGAPAVVAPRLIYTTTNPPGDVLVYKQPNSIPDTGFAIPAWLGHTLVTSLRGRQLQDVVFDAKYNYLNNSVYFKGGPPVPGGPLTGMGRIRDLLLGDEYALFVTTSNCDSRGTAAGFCQNTTFGDAIYQIIRGQPS